MQKISNELINRYEAQINEIDQLAKKYKFKSLFEIPRHNDTENIIDFIFNLELCELELLSVEMFNIGNVFVGDICQLVYQKIKL